MSERNGGWSISDHAWQRMEEMGLKRLDVLPVLLEPEQTYTSRGRVTLQRGDLAAVTEGTKVVTVLWRQKEEWKRRVASGLPR